MSRFIVLKDGHVGSKWFATLVNSYASTVFVFEATACMSQFPLIFGCNRSGLPCGCTKTRCVTRECTLSTYSRSCELFGVSVITPSAPVVLNWAHLGEGCPSKPYFVVHIRTNLAKWAYSFYRSAAASKLGANETAFGEKQHIHTPLFKTSNPLRKVIVDPGRFLRMMRTKQHRQQSIINLAHKLRGNNRLVVSYERLQINAASEMKRLFEWLGVPVPRRKQFHQQIRKSSPENLTKVILNIDVLATHMKPCGVKMLRSVGTTAFDRCASGCCWQNSV